MNIDAFKSKIGFTVKKSEDDWVVQPGDILNLQINEISDNAVLYVSRAEADGSRKLVLSLLMHFENESGFVTLKGELLKPEGKWLYLSPNAGGTLKIHQGNLDDSIGESGGGTDKGQ